MADKRNFLLGKGENLTESIVGSGRKLDKSPPYDFAQAQERLIPMLSETVKNLAQLPEEACPNGEVVGSVILNPEYIAMSYFPENLLKTFSLRAVGSRATKITPSKRSKNRLPVEANTTELFVAGQRSSFTRMMQIIPQLHEGQQLSTDDLAAVEKISALDARNKIKGIEDRKKSLALEIVLHASGFQSDGYILETFQRYITTLGLSVDINRRIHAGGLCFIGAMSPVQKINDLARFSFLRAVREMPKLRVFDPVIRSVRSRAKPITLPPAAPIDRDIRVAIFDGGLPDNSNLKTWVQCYDAPGVGAPAPELLQHGQSATSAALFGHLMPGETAPVPYTKIDHYRVLDQNSAADPLNLVDVLDRIRSILETSPTYDFINLSIGPKLAIEDDDVHAWTAVLDEQLAEGKTLATIAVGNDGELDALAKLNRVQVPADCVNAVSVGACDRFSGNWKRASYSSVGPGRSPGLIKPDLVAFGGSQQEPYLVLEPSNALGLIQTAGTSFAAPHSMRVGTGVRAHFGSLLSPLVVRALLIHTAETRNHPQPEVGWGRVSDEIDEIVVCKDGVVRVVYQGTLSASKYLRARLPMPASQLTGMVSITATCCYATPIDSAHPSNYTRSGIETFFRPHDEVFGEETSVHPVSETFLSQSRLYQTEEKLRTDAHKWETCCMAKQESGGLV